MSFVLLGFVIVAAVGTLLMWPKWSDMDSWWIGSGSRSSRSGRVRMLVSEVLLIGGLSGHIVVQVLTQTTELAILLVLVAEVFAVLVLVRLSVRRWRNTASASASPGAGSQEVLR